MAAMNDDDFFSSDSSDSSIDPSQLEGLDDALGRVSASVDAPEKKESPINDNRVDAVAATSEHAKVPPETLESTKASNPPASSRKIKIVIGESVLEWQRHKRRESLASSAACVSSFVALRDNQSTRVALANNAKITITPPAATLTSGDKTFTGKYASLSCSSAPSLVECVAVYDKELKAFVLEILDWTVSNLKPSSSEPPDSTVVIPATHPRQEQQHAEERVRNKRKKKKSSSPKPNKQPRNKTSPSNQAVPNTPTSPDKKYRGVTPIKRKKGTTYRAQISLEGKPKYLGTFATAEEAAKRYDQEARKKTKASQLNFPDDGPTNTAEEKVDDSS